MNIKSELLFLRGLMLTLPLAFTAIAQANDVNVVYINGIQNAVVDSHKTANKIRETLDASINHVGTAKRSFSVSVVWNPIGWHFDSTESILELLGQDKRELFLLKTAEEKFASAFRSLTYDHRKIIPLCAVTGDTKEAAYRVTVYLDDMTPGGNSLEEGSNPITDADIQLTRVAANVLATRVKSLGTAIVIAHSQGNLLANLAYAKVASQYGSDVIKMMRVVNVANNSEFSVNNLNFTHAGDAALYSAATSPFSLDFSLETLPSNGSWTRTTPYCNNAECNFTMAPATFAAQNDIDGQDPLGLDILLDHSIYETYLSTATVQVLNAQGVKFTPNANRFIDRFEDFVYAAADSLDNKICEIRPYATYSGFGGYVTSAFCYKDGIKTQPTSIEHKFSYFDNRNAYDIFLLDGTESQNGDHVDWSHLQHRVRFRDDFGQMQKSYYVAGAPLTEMAFDLSNYYSGVYHLQQSQRYDLEFWPNLRRKSIKALVCMDHSFKSVNNFRYEQYLDESGNIIGDQFTNLERYLDPSECVTYAQVNELFPFEFADSVLYREDHPELFPACANP